MATRSVIDSELTPRRRRTVEEVLAALRFQYPTLGDPSVTVSGRGVMTRSVSLCWNRRLTVEMRFELETDLPMQRWTARSRPSGTTRTVWRGGWTVVPLDSDPQLYVALDSLEALQGVSRLSPCLN